jgi:hypothetical protein
VKLAKELDGLPLALATAGAYLDQTVRSFSDYLRLYKESWARLQETSPELSSYEDRTLYSTWQISFDNIKQRNPLPAELLRLWTYFDNQDLWFELLRHGDSNDPEWLRELTKDELSFAVSLLPPGLSRKKDLEAIGTLSAYSFINKRSADQALDLHRLVYRTTRNWLRKQELMAQWTERAITRLEEV